MYTRSPQSCYPASSTTPDSTDTKSRVIASRRALLDLALQGRKPPHTGALNLIPCDAYEYSQLLDSTEDKYELVDGLLLCKEMPNRKHLEIQALLNHVILVAHATGMFNIVVYIEPIVNFMKSFEVTDAQASSSRDKEEKDSRIADVAIGEYIDRETRHDYSPNSKKNPFSIKRLPRVVIEVTSSRNYKNDVIDKWKQYAKYEIPEYYIIDCQKQCVVRGYFGGGPQYRSGDCEDSRCLNPKANADQTYYCREIYRKYQSIQGEYLGKLNLTANDVLNPQHLPDWLRELENKRKDTEEETKKEMALYREKHQKAEKKIQEYKDVTRRLSKDLDESKLETKVERERRETAEKEAKTEKKGRETAEEEAKTEKKKRETAEKKRKVAESKIEELEAQLEEFRKTLADPSIADSALAQLHAAKKRQHTVAAWRCAS